MSPSPPTRLVVSRILGFNLLAMVCLCPMSVAADEIVSSAPAKSAGGVVKGNESRTFELDLSRSLHQGKLKPAQYSEPEWVSSETETETPADMGAKDQVKQTSAAIEVEVTSPDGLDAPALPPSPAEADVPPSPNESHSEITEGEVIEEKVDLRPPVVDQQTDEDKEDRVEPSWIDPFVDDHLYLWRETREELELLFNNGNGFGMTSLGFDAKILVNDGPVWANLKFGWHFLDGPSQPDIRSQTYDLSFEFNQACNLNEDWALHMQLAPTWSTDWDNKTGDAFRIIGGGLLAYDCHDGCKFLIGGMYLDRPDLPFVPTVGLRFIENDFELDLLIPRPRFAWKLSEEIDEESWFYIAGELGGGSWAVERELSRKEIMSYRDYRLLVGWETKKVDGSRDVFEFGWVFDRQLEFDRYSGSRDLDDTFVMRWGHVY